MSRKGDYHLKFLYLTFDDVETHFNTLCPEIAHELHETHNVNNKRSINVKKLTFKMIKSSVKKKSYGKISLFKNHVKYNES